MRHTRVPAAATLAIVSAMMLASCSDAVAPAPHTQAGKAARDSRPDGLFADFMDGKFDSAGHPFAATVFEAETDCGHDTGEAEAEGWAAWPSRHPAGTLCTAEAPSVAKGVFTLSVRALAHSSQGASTVRVTVRDEGGDTLAAHEFSTAQWPEMTWQNLSVRFSHASSSAVSIEVAWEGTASVRLDYAELFRSERQLVLSPASGVIEQGTKLQFEFNDPPTGSKLEADCDGLDRTAMLQELIAQGQATVESTEFRMVATVPSDAVLQGCSLPARFRVRAVAGGYARATSRVSYRGEPPPCEFEPGTTAVLLTGFEPFPADSTSDNSAERAVRGFDSAALAGVSVMRLILPVEYDAAPGWVAEVIERCQPDIIVGFGQGRWAVDLETTAYNLKDTAEVAGGVPDNRGVIYGGEPIVQGGAASFDSGLPVAAILERLGQEGIESGPSDDPGRYVCNNLFYTIMSRVQGTGKLGGFVHLPRMHTVDAASQARLQKVVAAVVEESLAALRAP